MAQKTKSTTSSKTTHGLTTLLVIAHIDNGLLELPGRNFAVKQNVELTVRAVLELGQEEKCHDPADESSAAPDVAALATEVPAGGIEHLRGEVDHWNLCYILITKHCQLCHHLPVLLE
jgi:hypothetical protein